MARALLSSILLLTSAQPRQTNGAVEAQPQPLPGELCFYVLIHIVSKPVMASDLDDSVLSRVCGLVVSLPGRDEPIVVLGRLVDDRLVLVALWIITIVCLVLTGVWLNVLVSLLIGVGIILVHATFRNTEDLFLDEEEAAGGGLFSVVDSTATSSRATHARF